MVNALKRPGSVEPGTLPKTMAGFGITDRAGIMALFSTHSMEERIQALQSRTLALPHQACAMFKIEVEDDKGIWSDVFDAAGKLLTFEKEEDARAARNGFPCSCRWRSMRAASARA
jgi:hypothetical protein